MRWLLGEIITRPFIDIRNPKTLLEYPGLTRKLR